MRLVADLGGTNLRFGVVPGGQVLPDRVATFRNDDFTGFMPALEHYWTGIGHPDVSEAVIAVAGPVSGSRARLTNRDWQVDAAGIAKTLGGATVMLMNDLGALGHAVPHLGAGDVATIAAHAVAPAGSRQALVIGIGTGFNVSPVLMAGDTVLTPAAEYGHTPLPALIADRLRADFPKLAAMATVEDCFSGRGFARMQDAWHRRRASDGDPSGFRGHIAELLGHLARDLFLTFLPNSGIYFAGSVARAILQPPAQPRFAKVFTQPFPLSDDLGAPVHLILNDDAALRGCAAVPPAG
ncbi:glucokinase [Ruegeria sediminis]|uniref:Glucokinase n=1 Tax=Ruegeria sediminis TaxID=2583820 RepID=A0ABY2WWL9_9RHOB|nr:glucokinase [Ruegeria sediminis]TMV06846.1 glucokinase [Ruegeria sediminis]